MTRAFRSHVGHGEMAASAAPVISPRAGADPGQIFMTMHGPLRL